MKKGIAMASVVVIISVMILLISVITVTGLNTANTSKKISFASEIKMLQDSIDSYRTKKDGEYPINDFVTIDLTNASDDTKKQFEDNNEDILNNKVILNKVDYTKLDILNLTRGKDINSDDVYVVSNKTGIVYYAKGLKIGNETYYALTEELKALIKYNSKSDEVLSSDAIIFESSIKEWTNENIQISVKIPRSYTKETIKLSGVEINDITTNEDTNYDIYSFNVYQNGTLEVSYKDEKDQSKVSNFDITNIDKEEPELSLTNISNTNPNKNYLKVEGKDSVSGIKIIKYDIDKISSDSVGKIYFNSNGIKINNNIIEIDNNIPYITIYIEDNAGNYKIMQKEL